MKLLKQLLESHTLTSPIKVSFHKFSELTSGKEGIVCLGAGGDLSEWVIGVTNDLAAENIAPTHSVTKIWSETYELTTTGGRTDLVLVFNPEAKLNMKKMALWRLRFGDCSWISDYKVNYAKHHGVEDHDFDPEGSHTDEWHGDRRSHPQMESFAERKELIENENTVHPQIAALTDDLDMNQFQAMMSHVLRACPNSHLVAAMKEFRNLNDLPVDKAD